MKVKYRTVPKSGKWAFMSWFDIPSKVAPDRVYLRRLRVLQSPRFAMYLHWINEPDTDRHAHDHPWNFWSLILRGGYTEAIYERLAPVVVKRTADRWSWHGMPTTHAHSITSVKPGTITLVFTGRRTRTWCFWTEDGLAPWDQYLSAANDEPDDSDVAC